MNKQITREQASNYYEMLHSKHTRVGKIADWLIIRTWFISGSPLKTAPLLHME